MPPVSCPFALQKRRKPSGVQLGPHLQRLCRGEAELPNVYARLLKRNGDMIKAPKCSPFGFCNPRAPG